jgi:uncharacterized membrane protein
MELEAATIIDRPIEEVFARWSEVERYPEWFDLSIERRKVTEESMGVGAKYHAVDKLPPGRRVEGTLEITAYQPNSLVAARLSKPINATWEARFEEANGGTRMTFQTAASPSGLGGLFAPLFMGWARRQLQTGLDNFKASFESGAS